MKKGIFQRATLVLASLVAAIVPLVGVAKAQNNQQSGNGFRISPVRAEYTIEKGKSESLTISLENPSDVKTVAKSVVNNFVPSVNEDGEARIILDENGPTPKNNFKSLVAPLGDVELAPKEKKDVQVTISVPADANAGGYYGAVRFVPQQAAGGGNVGLTASVGTIVLIRVPGNLTERLDLVQLSASQNGKAKSFFTSGNVSALLRVKNTGDIHVQPFGKILVKNMFGKTVYDYEVNNTEPRGNVLPDSVRKFEDQIKAKGLIGRYTIQANVGYTQGSGNLILAKASFWYIPTWALIALLLVILAIAAAIYMFLKRRDNRQHKSRK